MQIKLIDFKQIDDEDGSLVFFETRNEIPFEIKRIFYIFEVSSNSIRANHASVNTDFLLLISNGVVDVELYDGTNRVNYRLKKKNKGLYVPRNTWIVTKNFSKDAVLLVFASEKYKDCVYEEDYMKFSKSILGEE